MSQTVLPISSRTASNSGLVLIWRWWTAELRAMLPPSMARWIDGDAVATDVTVDARGVTILNSSNESGKPNVAERVPLDALQSNPLLRDLIASGRDRVRLVLTPDQAMVKSITLPMATEENLRDVVGFELDRHTPFTPEQAYFDAQIVRRDPQQEKIVVSLVVASKVEVAALLDTLRRAGLTCSGVGIDTTAAVNAASVDLQPLADKPPRRLSRVHQINIGLIVLAALLALVAIILPIWQKREAVKELIPRAEKSGTEFLISERVYSEYTKLAAEYNFLAARKHAVYPVVSVLEELARTFPDTTWVQKLDIKPNGKVREVTLLGEALSTSKVIENLEQSPLSLFQNSKPQSATRLQSTTERFQVSTEIKPRLVPALEGIEEIASVMSPASIPASPAAVAPVDATIPSASGVLVAPVNPQARAAAVAPSVPTAPATSVTRGSAPTAPSNPPLTTFNGPPGTQYPPSIVPPPSFNSPLGQSQNTQNPPPGSLSPPPIVAPPSFNSPLGQSQNTQNPPPGSLSPPPIVPPPASFQPSKPNGL